MPIHSETLRCSIILDLLDTNILIVDCGTQYDLLFHLIGPNVD